MPRQQTKIEIATYKLMKSTEELMSTMRKDRKHSLGTKMFNVSLDMYQNIVTAILCTDERMVSLERFRAEFYTLSGLYRLSKDLGLITETDYIIVARFMDDIDKQQTSLYRYYKTKSNISENAEI